MESSRRAREAGPPESAQLHAGDAGLAKVSAGAGFWAATPGHVEKRVAGCTQAC